MKRKIYTGKIGYTWIISACFIICCLIFVFIDIMPVSFGMTSLGRFARGLGFSEYIEILGIQYTTVFLTTSLMSTLGENADYVYYENIIDRTLLEPNGLDFHSLSVYAFLTIAASTVAAVIRSPYIFLSSFVLGIFTITFLFFKMVKIYFQRSRWEKIIYKEITDSRLELSQYIDNIQKLRYVMSSNIENGEKEKVIENLAFVIELMSFFSSDESKQKILCDDKKREFEKRYEIINILYTEIIGKICTKEGKGALLDYLLQVIVMLKKHSKQDAIIIVADKLIYLLTNSSEGEISDDQLDIIRIRHRDSMEIAVRQKEERLFATIEKIDSEKWTSSQFEAVESWSSDPMYHLLSEIAEGEDKGFDAMEVSCYSYTYGCEAVKLMMTRTYPQYEIMYQRNEGENSLSTHLYRVIEMLIEKDEKIVASGDYKIPDKPRGFKTECDGLFSERLPRILFEKIQKDTNILVDNFLQAYIENRIDRGVYEINGYVGYGTSKLKDGVKEEVFETICISILRGFAEVITISNLKEYLKNLVSQTAYFFGIVSIYKEDPLQCKNFYENALELIGLKLEDIYVQDEETHGYIEKKPEKEELAEFKQMLINECTIDPFKNRKTGVIMGLCIQSHMVPLKGFDSGTAFDKFDNLFE